MEKDLSPRAVAPLFGALALLFAAAVLSRFDGFAGQVPPAVHGAALVAAFPLLLIGGALSGGSTTGTPARACRCGCRSTRARCGGSSRWR